MQRKSLIVFSLLVVMSLLFSACTPAATTTPTEAVVEPTQAPTEVMEPAATETTAVEPTEAEATATTVEEPTAEPTAEAAGVMLPEVIPGEVTGNIITAGSSTVYPLSEAILNLFEEEGYQDQVTIDSIGTGGGFDRFCASGETDISNASRSIKDSEVEKCNAINREPIEFRVGTDAIAVVVNPENDFVDQLTLAELALVYSDKVTTWADVNPEWPAEPIKRYSPGTDSGTYDFFIETVMQPAYEKDAEKAKEAFQNANPQQSEDDNVLVQGVEGDKYAIGYFGFAYFKEQEDSLKAVAIDGVEPNFESAESGDYPLSRPLFIYSDATILKEKPQVAAFINFYLTRVNEVIEEVGYFPASDEALNQAKQALLDATK